MGYGDDFGSSGTVGRKPRTMVGNPGTVVGNSSTVGGNPCAIVGDSGTVVDDSSGPMSRNPHTAEEFPVGDTSLSPGLVRSTYPGWGRPNTQPYPVRIALEARRSWWPIDRPSQGVERNPYRVQAVVVGRSPRVAAEAATLG